MYRRRSMTGLHYDHFTTFEGNVNRLRLPIVANLDI